MIVTELHRGQGLGNQLWAYVVTRVLALDKGFDFGIINSNEFKGRDFLSLDFGLKLKARPTPDDGLDIILPKGVFNYFSEKNTWYDKFNCDITDYDPGLLAVGDDTKIAGYFQSEKYISHRKSEIKSWLTVSAEFDCRDFSNEYTCVLNIRGGEYKGTPDLILQKKYWIDAINNMHKIRPDMNFVIVTDDVRYTKKLLPDYPSFHFTIGKDYSIINNAYYLVLSNSSFSFFPAWTNEVVRHVIAPKYWARHNISDGFWACAFNLYENWFWQDREGDLFTFAECQSEYANYQARKNISSMGPKTPVPRKPYILRKVNKFLDVLSLIKHKVME